MIMLKSFLYKTKTNVLKFLNFITPKNKRLILFISFPVYTDNPRYFHDYILQKNKNKPIKLMWLYKNKKDKELIKNNKLKGISQLNLFSLFRAKYIVVSHGPPPWKIKRQICIDLWHGLPLKTLGYYDKSQNKYTESIQELKTKATDFFVTTSLNEKQVFSSCFLIDPRKILTLGQPRCDALFESNKNVENYLKSKKFLNKKIIIFMPTYREGFLDKIDGKRNFNNIFNFENFDKRSFENFVNNNNICFFAKFHPFEEKLIFEKQIDIPKNLIILTNKELNDLRVTIYEFLPYSNLLITDYSSIYFDYLLLKKPILFLVSDIKIYEKNRGFIREPLDFWMPGPKVTSQNELQKEIISLLNKKEYFKSERLKILDIVFKYKDKDNCKRIYEHFLKEEFGG